MSLRVAVSSDHGGFELKKALVHFLEGHPYSILDLGVHSLQSVDYPVMARLLTDAIISGSADRGILVCGTGIGMSIAANKRPGIRAALCTDPYMSKMSREHNDANVLCLGGRVIGPSLAEEIVLAFLQGAFQGGRHARRVDQYEKP